MDNRQTVPLSEVMTATELADYLRVNLTTLQRLIKRRELPAFKIGRQWRFNVEDVDHWMKSRT